MVAPAQEKSLSPCKEKLFSNTTIIRQHCFRGARREYLAALILTRSPHLSKRIHTGATTRADSIDVLFGACRSAHVGLLDLSNHGQLHEQVLEKLAECSANFVARAVSLCWLHTNVPQGLLLRAILSCSGLQRLENVPDTHWKDENLAIVRHCCRNQVHLELSVSYRYKADYLLQLLCERNEHAFSFKVMCSWSALEVGDRLLKRMVEVINYCMKSESVVAISVGKQLQSHGLGVNISRIFLALALP